MPPHSAPAACCLVLAMALSTAAQERRPSQPVFRYVHEAKMICGRLQDHGGAPLTSGLYATTVNLYNPYAAPVVAGFDLRLASPPGQLQPGEVISLDPIELPPGRAVSMDCRAVKALAFPYGLPGGFLEGMLSVDALQPLVVIAYWSAAAEGQAHGSQRLTSIDVDAAPARAMEVSPPSAGWSDDPAAETFCDTLGRTSAVVTGLAAAQSYTFDEAADEGPREVTRLDDVSVLAGSGAVVGGPVAIRLRRGFFPDGRFLDTSEMPVLTVGERYLLLLPNHAWVHEPISLDDVFRIETVGVRDVLVDQDGFAVTDVEGGRTQEPVSTPEFLFRPPEMLPGPAPETAMSPEDFAAAIASADCPEAILAGPFTAYPMVPPTIAGAN